MGIEENRSYRPRTDAGGEWMGPVRPVAIEGEGGGDDGAGSHNRMILVRWSILYARTSPVGLSITGAFDPSFLPFFPNPPPFLLALQFPRFFASLSVTKHLGKVSPYVSRSRDYVISFPLQIGQRDAKSIPFSLSSRSDTSVFFLHLAR